MKKLLKTDLVFFFHQCLGLFFTFLSQNFMTNKIHSNPPSGRNPQKTLDESDI